MGEKKPSPELFLASLKHVQVQANEVIHVGDHPKDDIEGAQQLGIKTLWFNPHKKQWSDLSNKKPPDKIVNCLSEIVSTIKYFV